MKHSDYQKMKSKIEDTYQQEMAALNLLWKRYGDASEKSSNASPADGTIVSAVREAIATQGAEFSIKHILRWLEENRKPLGIKKSTVRVVLRRLTDKELEVIKEGAGRSPTLYRRRLSAVHPKVANA